MTEQVQVKFLELFHPSPESFGLLEDIFTNQTDSVRGLFRNGYIPGSWEEIHLDRDCFAFLDWEFITLESFGGPGQGDDLYLVFEVKERNLHHSWWKMPGHYSDNDGRYLRVEESFNMVEESFNVQPVQKQTIIYTNRKRKLRRFSPEMNSAKHLVDL